MSLNCERKTLHKYYSYKDKINVQKVYSIIYVYHYSQNIKSKKKKLNLVITDMITLRSYVLEI